MNYCDHCHGDGWRITNIGNKPIKCDECCGTGRATGAYESIPKVNGWNFWRVIEFIAAVIVLVVVGVIMTPSLLWNAVKDWRWLKLNFVKR